MGSHFSTAWIWTGDNIRSLLNIIQSLDKPVFHICSGMSILGDIRLDRTKITLTKGLKGRWKDRFQLPAHFVESVRAAALAEGMLQSSKEFLDEIRKYKYVAYGCIAVTLLALFVTAYMAYTAEKSIYFSGI